MKRTPKNYNGIEFPGKKIGLLLPEILQKIGATKGVDRDRVFTAWSELLSKKMASYTKPVSFKDGILRVSVFSSTLYSLLSQHEKPRLLKALQDRYPKILIRDIVFRIS